MKNFLIFLVLFLIALPISYYISSTKYHSSYKYFLDTQSKVKKPASDWQTYSNSKFNYSLSFTNPDNSLNFRSCTAGKPGIMSGDDIFVIFTQASAKNTINCYPPEWVGDIQIAVVPGNKASRVPPNWKKIVLGNQPGYLATVRFPESEVGGNTELTEAIVHYNNFTYTIYLGNPNFISIFNQILSTFKFTK
jgi:hypothetical protein